ncbi:MAG TPA: hypothetical protein VGS22_13825 [Thermoanaerobaculia bacterium]|jgi:ppGpp synthetase/RelA/SpoT-type nucleotidyltranferase|nr:hypothetical protein [Thermoanaerobaculia bacterium]
MALSKTQIDRLGDRLKKGSPSESDLRLLDDYRRSFGEAYEAVVQTIYQRGQFPTGRLAKSTRSIAEKLRRESLRLTQMQDIAGCRIVVSSRLDQENLVASLKIDFPEASVVDRREKPSFGYRAVHVVVEILDKPVEVQVRTSLQHMWAEVSEKCSDVIDPAIKYGGGSGEWRDFLAESSRSVAAHEELEKRCSELRAEGTTLEKKLEESPSTIPIDMKLRITQSWGNLISQAGAFQEHIRDEIIAALKEAITFLDEQKEKAE